jgi:hypothetical protein
VGLEDRDWYREQPSGAWKHRWDRSPDSRRSSGGGGSSFVRPGAWLAILVSAGAVAVTWKLDALNVPWLPGRQPQATSPHPVQARTIIQRPSNEIRLSADPALRTRARTPATWSITDPRFGTIKVPVGVGEVPLTAITHELTRRGYQVTLPASLP